MSSTGRGLWRTNAYRAPKEDPKIAELQKKSNMLETDNAELQKKINMLETDIHDLEVEKKYNEEAFDMQWEEGIKLKRRNNQLQRLASQRLHKTVELRIRLMN